MDLNPIDPPSPPTKKRRSQESHQIDSIVNTLEEVEQKITEKLDSIFEITKDSNIPLGLKVALKEAFQCKICLRSVSLPAMVATCCGQMIGCQMCTDTWYAGAEMLQKTCPACRAERAVLKLSQLRGMDSLIGQVHSLFEAAEEATDRDISAMPTARVVELQDDDDQLPTVTI